MSNLIKTSNLKNKSYFYHLKFLLSKIILMKITGETKRIKPKYTQTVRIPKKFKSLFWDCPNGKTYLEKFILRILNYGSFKDIKWLYKKYKNETFDIITRYDDIKKGVKFWIKFWAERGD